MTDFVTQAIAAGPFTALGGTGTRQLIRLFDPTEYEAQGFGKAFRYIPVVRSWFGAQPKINVFGEHMYTSPLHAAPEYTPTGGLLGASRVVDPNDPVWNHLESHPQLHLTMPGNNATVGHIKMTPEEIYVYHLARGPYLKEELARAFQDPDFVSMSYPQQNRIIKNVYEHAANVHGASAVYQYRKEHPVTPERRAEMLKAKGVEVPAVETAGAPPPETE